jgi:hypothetical protein
MSKGIVVIKVDKKPSAGKVESITTVMNNFKLSEEQVYSLIESGESFVFNDETYYFDESIDD